jgi:hypothetical protein
VRAKSVFESGQGITGGMIGDWREKSKLIDKHQKGKLREMQKNASSSTS